MVGNDVFEEATKYDGMYVGHCVCGKGSVTVHKVVQDGLDNYFIGCDKCERRTGLCATAEEAASAWSAMMTKESAQSRAIEAGDKVFITVGTTTEDMASEMGVVLFMPRGPGDLLQLRLMDNNHVVALNANHPMFYGMVRLTPEEMEMREKAAKEETDEVESGA